MSLVINGVTIVGLPVVPAQPNLPEYPVALLNTCVEWTRDTFFAHYGVQAPPPDPNRPYKTWIDTSGETPMYNVISDATGVIGKLTMTLAQAQSINLGAYTYPVFYSAPTTPAVNIANGGNVMYNASFLSDYQHALALARALWAPNAPPATAVTQMADEGVIQWNAETRRPWAVDAPNGGNYLAAPLIAQMWKNGVGHPGKWTFNATDPDAPPVWTDATTPMSTLGVVPTPKRALLSNEKIVAVSAGMVFMINRTDLAKKKVA